MVFLDIFSVIFVEIKQDMQIIKEVFGYHITQVKDLYSERKQRRKLQKKLQKVQNYEEWCKYAIQIDNLKETQIWKEKVHSKHYDYEYIRNLRDNLKENRQKKDSKKLIKILRSHAFKNIANILTPQLYSQCYIGTKKLIQDFSQELDLSLREIFYTDTLSFDTKLEFFKETRHALGRTALVFSGGAFFGLYHTGVAQTLYQQGLLPKIISGSSVGSITAAFVGTCKYEELNKYFTGEKVNYNAFLQRDPRGSFIRKIMRFFNEGYFMDMEVYKNFIRDNLGDKTFQEAYDQTGFILNITVTGAGKHIQDRVLNYLTAPNVVIWSAVCCSCSLPGVFPASDLICKETDGTFVKYVDGVKFCDGSIAFDVPHNKLSEMFNVNTFIVSQVNPYVIPLLNHSQSLTHRNKIFTGFVKILEVAKSIIYDEIKARLTQLSKLGILPDSVIKSLNILFQKYEGDITIWPIPKFTDYFNIFRNPTSQEFVDQYTRASALRCFQKLSYIDQYTKFERVVNECYELLKKQEQSMKKNGIEIIKIEKRKNSFEIPKRNH